MSALELEIPKGYLKTEYGIFPSDWSVLTLDDVCSFAGGAQPEKSVFSHKEQSGYIRLIQIRDYKSDKDIVYIPEKLARKKCLTTDIMIGRYGPPIFQILRGIEGAYNVALIKATPKENIEREFLYYFLKNDSLFELMDMLSQRSSGQTGVELPALKSYPIGLPTKKEQTAIANALSDVDALISEQEKLIAKKQAIKTATMQQLLTGRTRLPQFALREDGTPKGTKPSELGEIPEDWEVVELGSVARLYQPETISGSDLKDSGFPVYGANGLIGFFDRFNHCESEVIVTCRGSTCGTVNITVPQSWITGNAMVVDTSERKALGKIYAFFLLGFHDLTICISGSGQPQIVRSPLAAFKIQLPSRDEQTAIATILSDMDAEIQALEQRIGKTRQIKQGMMQELLTGKTRLPYDKE